MAGLILRRLPVAAEESFSETHPRRVLALLVSVGVGFWLAGVLLVGVLDARAIKVPAVDLDQLGMTRRVLAKGMRNEGDPDAFRVVFLGDSLSFPRGRALPAPGILRYQLRKKLGRRRIDLINLSIPGFTTFSHYLVSEEVVKVKAERVIIGVNLSWFSRLAERQQPVLAGLLPATRWAEAVRLPLFAIGLAAADMVIYRSAIASGHYEDWRWLRRQQGRFAAGYANWVGAFQKWAGEGGGMAWQRALSAKALVVEVRARRSTRAGARRNLGSFLDGLERDDPDLQTLEALVARYRAAGSEVLVLVQPTNVVNLRKVGVYDKANIEVSLARLRAVAERQGASFLDLHDLLPNRSFRDDRDHLALKDSTQPAAAVASRLLPWALGRPDWAVRAAGLPRVEARAKRKRN